MDEREYQLEQHRTGDAVLSVLEFKLSPDVPPEARKDFNDFQFAVNKLVPQGNFTDNDLLVLSMMFDEIVLSIEEGLFDLAKIFQYKFLHLVQSSRGRDGQYAILESRTKQYQEVLQRMESREQKQRKGIMRLFKNDDMDKEEE